MKRLALASIAFALLGLDRIAAQDGPLTDDSVGVSVALPGPEWRLKDVSAGGVVCHLYVPGASMVPRVALLRYPKPLLPDGMTSRAAQVERVPGVRRVRLEEREFMGGTGFAYEYEDSVGRTVERGRWDGLSFVIVQVAAPRADWEDASKAEAFARVFSSAKRIDRPALPTLRVDPKTPDQVRAARAKVRSEVWPYAIRDHDVRVDLWPDGRRARIRDTLALEGTGEPTSTIFLLASHVTPKGLFDGERSLPIVRVNDRAIRVDLGRPLAKGETRVLRWEAEATPFAFEMDQTILVETSMLGQVDPDSSFSSHVLYYPIDIVNDATVRLAIGVPEGYTAVSGGDSLGSEPEVEGRRVFRYAFTTRSARLLPLGFAAARYERIAAKTPSGLEIEIYFPAALAKEARQRLDVAALAVGLFEDRMGPLPWRRVAFCEVKPSRKETCVSLPGLVLLSSHYFGDLEGAEPSGARLDDPKTQGLLAVTDELSHQWNAYATGFPNELAEGVSTFTNLLCLEAGRGFAEYRAGVRYCAEAYQVAAEGNLDLALADPAIYSSPMYRAVAFCKVPAVLDMLRTRLGDEAFFRAWRHAFTALRGRRVELADFEREMGAGAGQDLHSFFERWLFQPGHPLVRATWSAVPREEVATLSVTLEQVQPGGPYDLPIEIEARFAPPAKPRLLRTTLSARRQEFTFEVQAVPLSLHLDPLGTLPLVRSEVVRAP